MVDILQQPECLYANFDRKPGQQHTTHYCPGCGHGILMKLIAEAISDLELQDRTLFLAPVGCTVFLYYYFRTCSVSAAHGRAPAVATGLSRAHPDAVTISYQGDGDLAAIGTNNALHAANRGENIITFFVNNTVYGMTGGQLAPTSLIGQKTTTSPYGRTRENDGLPLRMAEIIATLDAPIYVARTAIGSTKSINATRRMIRKGLQAQKDQLGYVFIEILSSCPTNWRMSPVDAMDYVENTLTKHYPLGVFKDEIDTRKPVIRPFRRAGFDEIAEVIGLDTSPLVQNGTRKLPRPTLRLKVAGFGGQGILSLGMILADVSMKKGLNVTWLPSYGPEMRGGVANCSVVLSEDPIGAPAFDSPDILIAMNGPSLAKFGPLVPEDGMILYNSSLIEELPEGLVAPVHAVDATDLAEKAGTSKAANTVMLGALGRLAGLSTLDEISEFLADYFPNSDMHGTNVRAARAGWEAVG